MVASYCIEKGVLLLILDKKVIEEILLSREIPLRKEDVIHIVNEKLKKYMKAMNGRTQDREIKKKIYALKEFLARL